MEYELERVGLKWNGTLTGLTELQKRRVEKLFKLLIKCENVNKKITDYMED